MTESLEALTARHAPTHEAAIQAVNSRKNWSPFRDSPSAKFHPSGAPELGKAAFEALLGRPFDLEQPEITGRSGKEVSPFTRKPLNIEYPVSDPAALIRAAQEAMEDWRKLAYETRVALCLEIAQRLYARNFEMAHSVMHVAGQSYTQAFSGSGPNALDRGIEALAYAAKAMRDVLPAVRWDRTFGKEDVSLDKRYTIVPRGIGLVICCASFPTWNAYPAMFASLATGNPVIVKPHPIAILPMAIVVQECRKTLSEYGCDPNLVTIAIDTLDAPVAQRFIDDPAVQIIDFTGSPRYGGHLERTVTGKLLFTETAGINSVVLESCVDLDATAMAIARATCLFSAQMCTSPQNVYVPAGGIDTADGHKSFEEVASALVAAIDNIADNPSVAAGIMGAVQAGPSCDLVRRIEERAAQNPGAKILRRPAPYPHPDYPDARTMTPLVVALTAGNAALYAEEHFGPVMFVIAAPDGDAAVAEATTLARQHGAISSYLYSTDEAFIDRSLGAYETSGMNLSINLHGAMWANFAAAYSDYHVTGLNPAGNACLADLAFVAGRFRIVQHRRPAVKEAQSNAE
ncbi:phenylacetic acid degradation protein PaaN [Parasphingorhabdus sp.]|uniref:phenylacetic acid degradation protein PaaN n=1 Tax=Parasphingorhabdus sp. TaxID=2709688 RepID=UPI0032EE7D0A